MSIEIQAQLQELLDKKACEEVMMRYGRTQDWLDTEGQQSCFWPDAEVDFGFFAGSGEEWVKSVMPHEMAAPRRWHLSSGVMVQVDGNKATGECYGITVATRVLDGGGTTEVMFGGRYLDELEKRDGEWRIAKRTYILDWAHQFPGSVAEVTGDDFALHVLNINQPNHPMYRRL